MVLLMPRRCRSRWGHAYGMRLFQEVGYLLCWSAFFFVTINPCKLPSWCWKVGTSVLLTLTRREEDHRLFRLVLCDGRRSRNAKSHAETPWQLSGCLHWLSDENLFAYFELFMTKCLLLRRTTFHSKRAKEGSKQVYQSQKQRAYESMSYEVMNHELINLK